MILKWTKLYENKVASRIDGLVNFSRFRRRVSEASFSQKGRIETLPNGPQNITGRQSKDI